MLKGPSEFYSPKASVISLKKRKGKKGRPMFLVTREFHTIYVKEEEQKDIHERARGAKTLQVQ